MEWVRTEPAHSRAQAQADDSELDLGAGMARGEGEVGQACGSKGMERRAAREMDGEKRRARE